MIYEKSRKKKFSKVAGAVGEHSAPAHVAYGTLMFENVEIYKRKNNVHGASDIN